MGVDLGVGGRGGKGWGIEREGVGVVKGEEENVGFWWKQL